MSSPDPHGFVAAGHGGEMNAPKPVYEIPIVDPQPLSAVPTTPVPPFGVADGAFPSPAPLPGMDPHVNVAGSQAFAVPLPPPGGQAVPLQAPAPVPSFVAHLAPPVQTELSTPVAFPVPVPVPVPVLGPQPVHESAAFATTSLAHAPAPVLAPAVPLAPVVPLVSREPAPAPAAAPASSPVSQHAVPINDLLPMNVPPPLADDVVMIPASTLASSAMFEGRDADLVAALNQVVALGASDLHVTSGAPPMLRVDGALTAVGSPAWSAEKVTGALYSLLSDRDRGHFEEILELDFALTIESGARFRVNYYKDRGAMGAAFRLIPNQITQLADLGVPPQVAQFAELRRGLVLVTGPTGSGKSTTLAALIDLVNSTRTEHIVTVEDPIEFIHPNKKALVHQREVGRDTHSFSAALKHVLRQDPDVILIGELRDLETVSTALTAAETGHLVFATLHTQDAPQTIDRLIDVFPPHQQGQVRSQVAATLQGVVCQTLVKNAKGTGRVVATEVLVNTPGISNLIREGKLFQIPTAMHAGRELGMHTMDQHLAELVASGKITAEAALEKVHDEQAFTQVLASLGVAYTKKPHV